MATLVRMDPTRELDSLQSEFNRLFDGFFSTGAPAGSRVRRWLPAIDVSEDAENIMIRADLPGIAEDDVEIEIEDRVLTISGERESKVDRSEGTVHRLERSYGSFSRSLTLPDGVDADAVEARFDRGVLEVTIPKPEERKPRRIEIAGQAKAIEADATEK